MIKKIFYVLLNIYVSTALSKQELTIVLEDSDNLPFEKVDVDGKTITGFHIDAVTAVAESLKWKLRWNPLPWSRAIDSMIKGHADAITFATESKARSENMLFLPGNVLHDDKICVITRKDFKKNKFNGTLESLYGERVALTAGYLVTKEIEEKKHKFNLIQATAVGEQLYLMLAAGRVDYIFRSEYIFNKNKNKPKFKDLMVNLPCLPGDKRYIAFSRHRPDYEVRARKFEQAFLKWKKSEDFKKLLLKYNI